MHSGRGVTETSFWRARGRAGGGSAGSGAGSTGAIGGSAGAGGGSAGADGGFAGAGGGSAGADGGFAGALGDDPFALLGLPARPGLSDDDVRAGWRRVAAATHPDREDGGDPARFGAAAAAYVTLKTDFGRGEAMADLGLSVEAGHGGRPGHRRRPSGDAAGRGGRHRARPEGRRPWTPAGPGAGWPPAAETATRTGSHGRRVRWAWWRRAGRPAAGPMRRPGGMLARVAAAAVMGVVAVVISGWSPGVVGVLVGVLTWLLASAGRALARRRSR
jgi:hypothetical protein